MGGDVRKRIAKRAAKEIKEGMIVNLGIGIPTLVADYVRVPVMFHAENGILGTGPTPKIGEENENLCNAGGFPITVVSGASYFDSSIAFAVIRKGLVDMTILGALEVSERGDLANWIVPGKRVPGMGGAMELAEKAKKVIVLMKHVDKYGKPKIVSTCHLPLTAEKCVNMIITDMAVFHIENEQLILSEIFEPYEMEEVLNLTDANVLLDGEIKTITKGGIV